MKRIRIVKQKGKVKGVPQLENNRREAKKFCPKRLTPKLSINEETTIPGFPIRHQGKHHQKRKIGIYDPFGDLRQKLKLPIARFCDSAQFLSGQPKTFMAFSQYLISFLGCNVGRQFYSQTTR
jgi:hypothetical protein